MYKDLFKLVPPWQQTCAQRFQLHELFKNSTANEKSVNDWHVRLLPDNKQIKQFGNIGQR